MKLLVAEDQFQLLTILKERLEKDGYIVDAVSNGESAIDFLDHSSYDCVILDVMMPKKDGHEVLNWMRFSSMDTPVIFLTAKDTVSDRVEGLNLGADDYLIKPFAYEELLARVKALTKRKKATIQDVLMVGDLTLNRTSKEVKRQENVIALTKKEYNLLEILMLHKGETMTRERLDHLLSNMDFEGYSNVIDVYIRFLRKKIDEPFDKALIYTVRGFGYMIKDDV